MLAKILLQRTHVVLEPAHHILGDTTKNGKAKENSSIAKDLEH
jgi:hypothetical protein